MVFVVATCILGAEIAAARLLAPSFGASTNVWANTIGLVLVARSVGYWYGGRLADRNPTPEGLYRIVLASSLLLGAVPFVAARRTPRRAMQPITRLSPSAMCASAVRRCRRASTSYSSAVPFAWPETSQARHRAAGRSARRVCSIDLVGPSHGTRRLEDYLQDEAGARAPPSS